jgi:urease accessory protein
LLLLADGRLPAGGYAHSGGLEAAVAAGTVTDLVELERFLLGRLHTTGALTAGFAAAACAGGDELRHLEISYDACTPSAPQRAASRSQGRALLRVAARMWPGAWTRDLPAAPHSAIVLGVLVRVVGSGPAEAALLAALASVTGPASAAVRLLSLDPVEVQVLLAALAPRVEQVADEAVRHPSRPGSVLLDVLAEAHGRADLRLFAS